jgi:hypothetical protein
LKVDQRLEGTSSTSLLHASCLLGLSLNLEDGGDISVKDVGLLSTNYTELHARRQNYFKRHRYENEDDAMIFRLWYLKKPDFI